jgi:predicted nucleic acid-binding protein
MSGFLFDTNVLLDIATADPVWLAWSENQFRTAAAQGPILINPIIYAELAPAFASAADLDRWLDPVTDNCSLYGCTTHSNPTQGL